MPREKKGTRCPDCKSAATAARRMLKRPATTSMSIADGHLVSPALQDLLEINEPSSAVAPRLSKPNGNLQSGAQFRTQLRRVASSTRR